LADLPRIRCAIYTRKSSEEGLEQAYNSLQAQQDACAAYILSQKHEGWERLPKSYDDGGYSGGNLQRPSLQMLLHDAENRELDVVAVYKIDRLTRSLSDFSKLADLFERNRIALVAVTQQFNTATPMGRLTLNVLLTFAQFERELIAERLRDKKTASRKRGMWMGGQSPLGYDVINKKLHINLREAETVKLIFRRILQLRSISRLAKELQSQGIVSKQRRARDGATVGGVEFTWNPLKAILTNPIYRGLVVHNGHTYPGEHLGIIEVSTFDEVQALLVELKSNGQQRRQLAYPFLLKGIIFDMQGERLYTTYTRRHGKMHRYYFSKSLVRKSQDAGAMQMRIAADLLERYVVRMFSDHLRSKAWITEAYPVTRGEHAMIRRARLLARELSAELNGHTGLIQRFISRVELDKSVICLTLNRYALMQQLKVRWPKEQKSDPSASFLIKATDHLLRCTNPLKMVSVVPDNGLYPDHRLVREVLRAIRWFSVLSSGTVRDIRSLARLEKCSESLITHRLRLAFLAPDIVEAILEGRQPKNLTQRRLIAACPLPPCWDDQRALLLGGGTE
jgi:site-specific DNA recombinase